MTAPVIGDKLRFKPSAYFESLASFGGSELEVWVTGTVIYINALHRFFRCEYENYSGCIGHECFKF